MCGQPPMRALPRQGARAGRLAALVLLLLGGACGRAQARVELRFLDARQLPDLGLQLRILSNAREVPLPPPSLYPYRLEVGTTVTERVEMHAPRELWIAAQHAAEWTDNHGNTMRLAVVRRPLPGPFRREHVTFDEYQAAADPERAPEAWQSRDLEHWVAEYTGVNRTTATRPALIPPRFADLMDVELGADRGLASLFRLNPRPGAGNVPGPWILVWFKLGPETDVKLAQQSIRSRFWPYVQSIAPASGPGRPAAATLDEAPARTPAFLASRQQAADSIRHLKDWWLLESPDYLLLTNMRTGERSTARQLLANVSRLREAYAKLVPARVPIDAVSVIRIPRSEQEYIDYVGGELAWSGGLWVPNRKELILRSLEGSGTREQRETLFRAAYHEAFHQYVNYALDHLTTSAWFNEGHAAMFETVEIQNRGITIREDPVKTQYLQGILKAREIAVGDILKLTYDGFYAPAPSERIGNYVLAWGLVHYLRHGLQNPERSPYALIMETYLDTLMTTRDERRATETAFANVNLDELQRDFKAFWSSPSRRADAERNRY